MNNFTLFCLLKWGKAVDWFVAAAILLALIAGLALVIARVRRQRPRESVVHGSSRGALGSIAGSEPLFPGTPEPNTGETETEKVSCTAFSRDRMQGGETAIVQVALHLPEDADAAAERARESDPETARRAELDLELQRGMRLTLALDVDGASVEPEIQQVTWRGRVTIRSFAVTAPPAGFGETTARLRLLLFGIEIGRCFWKIAEGEGENLALARLRRHKRAFLSYSSQDRAEVLRRAQVLDLFGIGYFQDLLSLKPGDRFAQVIERELQICDVFMLFWSKHAIASQWVKKEALLALERQQASDEALPEFAVIALEVPPPENPFPELQTVIHLNDPIAYVISKEDDLRSKRRV